MTDVMRFVGAASSSTLLVLLLQGCSARLSSFLKSPVPPDIGAASQPPSCVGVDKVSLDRVSNENRDRIAAHVSSTLADVAAQSPSRLLLVRVDGCSVTWLKDCVAEGRYGMSHVELDDTQTFTAGELSAQLSDGSALALAQSSPQPTSAKRQRSVRGVLGFDADPVDPWQYSMHGDCNGATHVVRNIALGASLLEVTRVDGSPGAALPLGNQANCGPARGAAAGALLPLRSSVFGDAPAAAAAPPPAPPLAGPTGCDVPLELQLERISCPDSFAEWSGSRCRLKPLGPVLAKSGNVGVVPLAQELPESPQDEQQKTDAANVLTRIIATLCGKSRDSGAITIGDCGGRSPAEYEAIALAASYLSGLFPKSDSHSKNAYPEGLFWKGTAYYALGETAKALAAYSAVGAVEESPRAPAALEVFAAKACSEGRVDQASILYGQIARRFPNSPDGKRAQELAKSANQKCSGPSREQKPGHELKN